MVEERMNAIKTPFDMIAASGPISEMIAKIEKLVKTCQAIEEKTGITLDKNQVMQMGDMIINVIIKNIQDLDLPEEQTSDLLSKIAEDLDSVFKPTGPISIQDIKQTEAVVTDKL
jgi:hypothetical protein